MAFTDFNSANKQRLRRNAQRTKHFDQTGNVTVSSTGGLQNSGGLGIKLDGSSLSLSSSGLQVADADRGDITVSGNGQTWTIDNDVVTFAKMQNIATDTLIGRDTAGSGDPESISVTGGIVFSGSGSIQTTAFTGDVTKALGGTALTLATVNSNVGTFNTLTVNGKGLVTAASNTAYLTTNQTITLSGDVTGSGTTAITTTIANDAVTFAKMQNITTACLIGRNTAGTGDPELITLGTGLSFTGTTLNASSSSPLTTKGDIFTHDTADVALPVGTDFTFLSANSGTSTGLSWANPYSITGNVTNSTVTNTTTKSLIAAGLGLTAAQVTAVKGSTGSVQSLNYAGTVTSNNATHTLTLTLAVVGNTGTITDIGTTVMTMAGTESNVPIWIRAIGGWLTDGATGTARGAYVLMYGTTSVVTLNIPSSTVVTDTTGGGNVISLYATWSAASAGNILTKRALWSPFLSIGIGF